MVDKIRAFTLKTPGKGTGAPAARREIPENWGVVHRVAGRNEDSAGTVLKR
jgi:hypothetical protein